MKIHERLLPLKFNEYLPSRQKVDKAEKELMKKKLLKKNWFERTEKIAEKELLCVNTE